MTDQIERQLDLSADPDDVWQAITEPEWLESWLAEAVTLELFPGGAARFVVDGEPREGWVEEVSPPTGESPGVLAFWWQADGEPASRVCIELEPLAGGTRLRVVEARPLELLDLVGIPLGEPGRSTYGPSLVAV